MEGKRIESLPSLVVSRRIEPEREMKPHGCPVPIHTIADSGNQRAYVDNELPRVLESRKRPQDGIPCDQQRRVLRKGL